MSKMKIMILSDPRLTCMRATGDLRDALTTIEHPQQAIMELQHILQHQEQVTERLSSVLYSSEKSRQIFAGKVEKLELDLAEAFDENMSLNSRIQALEMAATKSARQLTFLQSQLKVQSWWQGWVGRQVKNED
jgi:F0F1-type ATP synthase delta subunit